MQKAILVALVLITLAIASLLVDPPEPAGSGGLSTEMAYDSP
jgi:hypothetical protein